MTQASSYDDVVDENSEFQVYNVDTDFNYFNNSNDEDDLLFVLFC